VRLLTVGLILSFFVSNAAAATYHYTHSRTGVVGTAGQAILIKKLPGVLHTVTVNSGDNPAVGQAIYLLDTNSAAECTLTVPPIAPVIAIIKPTMEVTATPPATSFQQPFTTTYDLTTTSGLCLVNDTAGDSMDITVTWN
jgi:hypothetical protein